MRNTILGLFFLLTSSLCLSQSNAKIELNLNENTLNYGLISKKSDNGIRSIEFSNTGNTPLLITNVLATSGFSIIYKPTTAILPGKTGKIDIKYNMSLGPIRKTITLETNAKNYESGIIPIRITGEVSD